jgi:DNA-binding NarL/FixJ family response regulator
MKKIPIIILSRAGLWRDALESYLKANPGLDIWAVGEKLEEIDRVMIRDQPALALIEMELCEEALDRTPGYLQKNHPDLRSIIIVDTPDQYRAAITAGAEHVAMKSMLHERLDEILSIIIQQKKGKTLS